MSHREVNLFSWSVLNIEAERSRPATDVNNEGESEKPAFSEFGGPKNQFVRRPTRHRRPKLQEIASREFCLQNSVFKTFSQVRHFDGNSHLPKADFGCQKIFSYQLTNHTFHFGNKRFQTPLNALRQRKNKNQSEVSKNPIEKKVLGPGWPQNAVAVRSSSSSSERGRKRSRFRRRDFIFSFAVLYSSLSIKRGRVTML